MGPKKLGARAFLWEIEGFLGKWPRRFKYRQETSKSDKKCKLQSAEYLKPKIPQSSGSTTILRCSFFFHGEKSAGRHRRLCDIIYLVRIARVTIRWVGGKLRLGLRFLLVFVKALSQYVNWVGNSVTSISPR